jgi:hypothetical protein
MRLPWFGKVNVCFSESFLLYRARAFKPAVRVNKIQQTSKFLELKNGADVIFLSKIFIAYSV